MCGIVGYVGQREAEPILIEGLRRLEYRGYDSAGVATVTGSRLHLRKRAGRIAGLASHLEEHPAPGTTGISHTRWATHGPANDRNAHPHLGGDGVVAVVHNGVIENYAALKRQLQAEGVRLPQRHRHRGHRPSDRQPTQRRPGRGGRRGAAAAQGHLRPGRRQPAGAGRAWSAPAWAARWCSASARAKLPGQRPQRPGRLRPEGRLPRRSSAVRADGGRLADLRPRAMPWCRPRVHDLDLAADEPTRATSSITCSRRSTSSPRRWRTPCAAGSTRTTAPPTSAA